MRMIEPSPDTLAAATAGELRTLDEVLTGIQPGVHGLALRMLGQREDAADATQEILLNVVTHFASFRGGSARTLTPEEKPEARQAAVSCTQSMRMALDRDQRLVYLLDSVFDLSSTEAAQVLGLTAEAYRQRLSRAKARLEPFMRERCGLVNEAARCRCERQVDALRHVAAASSSMRAAIRAVLVQEGFMDRGAPQ